MRFLLHKTSRALALAFLVLLAGTGLAFTRHNDELILKLPPGWKEGYSSEDRRTQVAMVQLVREGDDIHHWKELLTEISYPVPHGVRKPEEMLDHIKALREKECRGATVWNVIETDGDSITYEWHVQHCLDQPEQLEIDKILLGKTTCYFVQYARKAKELPADERDTWLKWLADVKLAGLH